MELNSPLLLVSGFFLFFFFSVQKRTATLRAMLGLLTILFPPNELVKASYTSKQPLASNAPKSCRRVFLENLQRELNFFLFFRRSFVSLPNLICKLSMWFFLAKRVRVFFLRVVGKRVHWLNLNSRTRWSSQLDRATNELFRFKSGSPAKGSKRVSQLSSSPTVSNEV